MLSGVPPFIARTDSQISELIIKGDVQFPQNRWSKISLSAKDLVQKMLTYDPEARISAK